MSPASLTSLCFPWRLGPVHKPTGPVHPVWKLSTEAWADRRLTKKFSTKSDRERKRERESVCGWPLWDFWLKIGPMSFSPFCHFLCLPSAGVQAEVEAEAQCLCLGSNRCLTVRESASRTLVYCCCRFFFHAHPQTGVNKECLCCASFVTVFFPPLGIIGRVLRGISIALKTQCVCSCVCSWCEICENATLCRVKMVQKQKFATIVATHTLQIIWKSGKSRKWQKCSLLGEERRSRWRGEKKLHFLMKWR